MDVDYDFQYGFQNDRDADEFHSYVMQNFNIMRLQLRDYYRYNDTFLLNFIYLTVYGTNLQNIFLHRYVINISGSGTSLQGHLKSEHRQQSRDSHGNKVSRSGGVAQVALARVAAVHLAAMGDGAFVVLLANGFEVAITGHNSTSAICG